MSDLGLFIACHDSGLGVIVLDRSYRLLGNQQIEQIFPGGDMMEPSDLLINITYKNKFSTNQYTV